MRQVNMSLCREDWQHALFSSLPSLRTLALNDMRGYVLGCFAYRCLLTIFLCRWARIEINQRLLDDSALPGILKVARQSLFPDGAFAAARPIPSPDEIILIRRDCGRAILQSVPSYVRRIYFATSDEAVMLKDIDEALDVLSDAYINKALIISLVELLVARTCPELV